MFHQIHTEMPNRSEHFRNELYRLNVTNTLKSKGFHS